MQRLMFYILLSVFYLNASPVKDLTIGDDCQITKSVPGNCKNLNECSVVLEEIKHEKDPKLKLCTFENKKPIICCQKQNNTVRISKQKCTEYGKMFEVFSYKKIIHGRESNPALNTHMAVIGFEIKNLEISWKCSGSLISEHYVLTAAVCSKARNLGHPKIVRLGVIDFENIKDEPNLQDIKVSQIYKRPKYNLRYRYGDIALLKLETPVKFNQFVRPACLPYLRENSMKEYILSGWEMNEQLKTYISNYKNIREIPREECNKHFVQFKGLSRGIDNETQICAIPNEIVCKMVVGSALLNKNKETHYLSSIYGLVSFGQGCGDMAPIVFTRISAYIGWIENIVWP